MKSIGSIIAAPLLCVGLVAGITAEKATQLTAEDAAPYHARAKQAVEGFKYTIGLWTGSDREVRPAAVKLLRPNAIMDRYYQENVPAGRRGGPRGSVEVLIVQCRDSRDMVGHYPEVCYVNSGQTLVSKKQRPLQVADVTIDGTEYIFTPPGQRHGNMCVYNFLVVPNAKIPIDERIVPDMSGVNAAAEDYEQRHWGAAQFQFVMPADLPRAKRDQAVKEILGANLNVLKVLRATTRKEQDL